MQPIPNPHAAAADEPEDVTRPTLIVQTGRHSGTRRQLTLPLTVIGRAPGCDVRLNNEEVAPLHCLIAQGPNGLVLRDLSNSNDTTVNDEPISTWSLHHGDRIGVGHFCFRLELPAEDESSATPIDPAALQSEREALRIQAAAVAAQQAALTEEEHRLQQRKTALKRQEEQLAAHLEERRAQLLALQEQTRQDRQALKNETAAAQQEQETLRASMDELRQETESERAQAGKERRRLVELRKRLKQRWRKHWQVQEADLRRREQELAGHETGLRKEAERFQRERSELVQAQLRFNGEVELGRRQLREEWQQLGLAQQKWEECLNQEQVERARQSRALEERAAALHAAEQTLAEQQRHWQRTFTNLQRDVIGLENRIRNQRNKLIEQEKEARGETAADTADSVGARSVSEGLSAPTDAANSVGDRSVSDSASVLADATGSERNHAPASMEENAEESLVRELACTLADQRWHLLEQWQGLLQVHASWEQEHEQALANLEGSGNRLEQREQRVLQQEQALTAGLEELRQRQEVLSQVRCSLEGWQARLTAREATWQAEHGKLLAELSQREELAAARVQRVEDMRQRLLHRYRKEATGLRSALARCEELRQHHVTLWQECQQRRATLAQEQRGLAAQTQALENFRSELLGRAPDSAAAEKRLERLSRRSEARVAGEERDLVEEHRNLQEALAQLDAQAREMHQQEQELAVRRERWVRQQTEWEHQRNEAEEAAQRQQQELQRLQILHAEDERLLAQLRDEVERIARLLMDEVPSDGDTTNRAA